MAAEAETANMAGIKMMAEIGDDARFDSSASDVPEISTPATLHVFLLVIGDSSWPEVIFMLGRIQKDTYGRDLHLTVCTQAVPEKIERIILRMGCHLYVGQLSNGPKMIQAGLLEADVILVSNGAKKDAEVLSKLCIIKKLQVHACCDNALLLCELRGGIPSLDIYSYVTRYHYMSRATGKKILSESPSAYFIKGNDGVGDLGEKLCTHEHFLAGGVILPDTFGYVLARMVYLPATIELFGCLMQPTEAQNSIMGQVKVPPKFIDRPYKELALEWIGCKESILPLGLYRTQEIVLPEGDSTDVRYFVTMPSFDTVLSSDDYVTVIAPRDWIATMGRKRLLRCGRDMGHQSKKGHNRALMDD
jgi:hypothetical protein